MKNSGESLAVLISGGVDSAVLLGEALADRPRVYPIHVRTGSVWEAVELEYLRRYLSETACPALQPLTLLDQPVADLYGQHWSMTGDGVPGSETPDDAVYLPGRNVLLLAKPLIWCHMNHVKEIALAPLAANPFSDATPEFFAEFASAVNRAVGGSVRVTYPYINLNKIDVLRRGRDLPLRHTFSCMRPIRGKHCGQCNKCAERRQAFGDAKMNDPTEYSA
jgi:7-cyano-7-deazaguanine synthase